ncbi:hypothetical protein BDZ97DRAFT_189765 [Flammula alnicola]|nr:hypothetical protein BDZ97DRAFT_189765 [Flammula alnicola]
MPAKAQNPGFKTCLHNCHPEKTPAASRKAAIIRNLPIFNTTSRGQHNHNLTHTCGEGASRCVAQTAENRITTDREYVKFSGRLVKGLQQGSQLSALTIARYKEAWGKLYPGTEPPMTTDGFPADLAFDDDYTTEDIPWLERFLEQGGKLKVTARPSRATPMVDDVDPALALRLWWTSVDPALALSLWWTSVDPALALCL